MQEQKLIAINKNLENEIKERMLSEEKSERTEPAVAGKHKSP